MRLGRILRRREPPSEPAPMPFVVGVTRSGTTLLRLMLDAHPLMAVPPETHFLEDVIDAAKEGPLSPVRFVEVVTGHRRWPDFGLEQDELRQRVEAVGSESESVEPGLALRAFYGLYAERAGKERWGDKTPGYLRRMAAIERFLPEARFIHLIRDGRDVAVSITGLHFGPDTVAEAAARWAKRIRRARSQGEQVAHYREVRYEDLVLEPEATLRSICEFIDLPWDEVMLAYHESAEQRLEEITRDLPRSAERGGSIPAAQRVGIHELASAPPQSDRVGRWRSEMNEDDQRAFAETAGDLLGELGYPEE